MLGMNRFWLDSLKGSHKCCIVFLGVIPGLSFPASLAPASFPGLLVCYGKPGGQLPELTGNPPEGSSYGCRVGGPKGASLSWNPLVLESVGGVDG